MTCIQCADFQSSCKLQNHILWIFFSCHMNEPILTILTSIQAVKCTTKIGLRDGMGNGGYTERVLGPIIWQSSLEIVHEPGWPRLPSWFALSACVNPSNFILNHLLDTFCLMEHCDPRTNECWLGPIYREKTCPWYETSQLKRAFIWEKRWLLCKQLSRIPWLPHLDQIDPAEWTKEKRRKEKSWPG